MFIGSNLIIKSNKIIQYYQNAVFLRKALKNSSKLPKSNLNKSAIRTTSWILSSWCHPNRVSQHPHQKHSNSKPITSCVRIRERQESVNKAILLNNKILWVRQHCDHWSNMERPTWYPHRRKICRRWDESLLCSIFLVPRWKDHQTEELRLFWAIFMIYFLNIVNSMNMDEKSILIYQFRSLQSIDTELRILGHTDIPATKQWFFVIKLYGPTMNTLLFLIQICLRFRFVWNNFAKFLKHFLPIFPSLQNLLHRVNRRIHNTTTFCFDIIVLFNSKLWE